MLVGLALALVAAAGPRIVSVRLDLPGGEAASLRRYVELEPGDELRPEGVRHAVELLYATGRFADVVVETEETPSGVAVVFRPVPSPLLREVIVEGDRVVDEGDVRRLARLSAGEALWPRRMDRAAGDLTAALQARGYLRAAVTVEARRQRQGADAVVTIEAGEQAHVRSVSVRGAPAGLLAFFEARARPAEGEVFDRRRADASAEAMRAELVRRDHWRAEVSVRADADGPLVALAFEVTAGPRVSVALEGADLPGGVRRRTAALVRDGRLGSDVVDEAADRLEAELRDRGHRRPTVRVERNEAAGSEELVFHIEPGPRARVASVSVEGSPVPRPPLEARPGEPLREAALVEDEKRLERALEDGGYVQPAVEAEVPEGGGDVPVTYRVRPGVRTEVEAVAVEPAALFTGGPAREMRLRQGEPFRLRDVAADRLALLTDLRDAGHLRAEVAPEVAYSTDRRRALVTFRVQPGPVVTVDHVVIAGLERTHEEVVRRELLVREDEPLGEGRLLESQRRLGALGLFSRVTVTQVDPESAPRRTVVVQARESPLTTVAYGVGYAERDQLRASVEVTRRNLLGMDRSLSAFARASFRGSRFLATFREPYLLGRRQELFVTAFREEEDRLAFDFVRAGLLAQTAIAPREGLRLIFRYTYQLTDTFNVLEPDEVDRQFADSTLSGPSASLVHDTRDDPFEPRRGHFLSADAQLSHEVLGGDSFVKGFLQATRYQRLRVGTVLAAGGRLGLARTFGPGQGALLPRPDRFYAGGDYSLRGFPVDGVLLNGGNGLVLASLELRVDLGRHFSAAAFADAGNVFPLVRDLDLGDLRYTAGAGLRYRSALGPLRADWAHKLDRRPGESAHRFHFTLGHAF